MGLPPALRGLPLLGNAAALRRDPLAMFAEGHERLGPVFSVRIGPMRAAVLVGPEHQRFFFTETDRTLTMREVYKFVIPMFGEVGQAAPIEEYREQRALLLPAFRPKRLAAYAESMVGETSAWLDTLGEEGEFDLWTSFEQLAMYIAASALLGDEFRRRLGAEFWALYRDVAGGMEFVLPTNLPLPRFRRRDRAKRALLATIAPEIAARRARRGGAEDFVQTLAEATYPDGRPVPDETIVGMILSLVFAAYDTTAAQTCWSLIQLLQHPAAAAPVIREVDDVLGGLPADRVAGELQALTLLDRSLRETERMRPITTMLWRHTARAYDIGEHHVPQGWVTMICPSVTGRMERVFPHADVYDPGRFAPGREAEAGVPFCMANFGGAAHRCLGVQFAYHEMRAIIALLLRSYHLELAEPDPRPDFSTGITRPASPCLVRYRRRAVTGNVKETRAARGTIA